MEPWQHFVPLEYDSSDITSIVRRHFVGASESAVQNGQHMAQQLREFGEQHLSKESMLIYYHLLLAHISWLQDVGELGGAAAVDAWATQVGAIPVDTVNKSNW